MKIAFITSFFGNPDVPSRFKRVKSCDYFLFGDKDASELNTSWDVHNISDNINVSNLDCNIRKSRYPKFMGWELLNSMGLSYDCIYYCDASYSPDNNVDWVQLSQSFIDLDYPFLQSRHPAHWNVGIMAEAQKIVLKRKDTKDNVSKTINFFLNNSPETPLSETRFYENTIFGYRPSEKVKIATSDFWDMYINSDISYRDQLSWNFLLLKNNLHPKEYDLKKIFLQTGKYGEHRYV